ncbi:hypothetical protein LAJ19_20620 (plasmid) [Deinococcus taeanensis]|uniref:hypothetical protein n=1 Tax=Deinococcus taeanensis TaxID=2737050 RepID=UPI001CDD5C23|nr:hypothetical protein [Deinococcus taeanensis]UBV45212.1 hypothetical protein LAJ19_20620 [Deinococcus taeanensis]
MSFDGPTLNHFLPADLNLSVASLDGFPRWHAAGHGANKSFAVFLGDQSAKSKANIQRFAHLFALYSQDMNSGLK